MDERNITLLVADDHELFLEGLCGLLAALPGLAVLARAGDGRALVSLARRFRPDIILTDLKMPVLDGTAAIREIVSLQLPSACLALTNFDSDALICGALEAGARGYIHKSATKKEMMEAIQAVWAGKVYFCRSTSLRMTRMIARSSFYPGKQPAPSLFSEREKEVILLICEEKTNEEIGAIIFLSPRTVERIRTGIYDKMKVKGPAGVVLYAIRNNLLLVE